MDYDREKAVAYAHRWAFSRNPRFADFERMGGDCTNFVSQCLFAGGAQMDTTPVTGWYYFSLENRAPAWSGVEEFYRFVASYHEVGPSAVETTLAETEPGDVVQFDTTGERFHHAALIVEHVGAPSLANTLVVCHSFDSDYRPLSTYNLRKIRFLHITKG